MVLLSSGIKDFHFLPLIKNIKARVTTLSNVSRKADQLKVEQALSNDYNDRIWLPWNNGGNSFKIHAGFFKISYYHTSGRFKPSAKLMIRQILPVGVILVDFLGCK